MEKNIPLYDPQTGEPNHEYEKLTGKPNPLMEKKGAIENFLVPNDFQPITKNNFIVVFPESFGIPKHFITKVKLPKLNVLCKSPRLTSDVMIGVMDDLTSDILKKITEIKGPFKFEVLTLDSMGEIAKKITFHHCLVNEILIDELNYKDGGVLIYELNIKARDISFNL